MEGANQPEDEQARGRISHAQRINQPGANEPGGEIAMRRTGKRAKKPDSCDTNAVNSFANAVDNFYVRKQLLLSARLSHCNSLSVCLSVRPSVCHTGGSVKNGAS